MVREVNERMLVRGFSLVNSGDREQKINWLLFANDTVLVAG